MDNKKHAGLLAVIIFLWMAYPLMGSYYVPIGQDDSSTKALSTIDYAHKEVHGGNSYAAVRSSILSSGDSVTIHMQTPDTRKWLHLIYEFQCSALATVTIVEGGTYVADGDTAIIVQRNRNSTNVSGASLWTGTATPTDGTTLGVYAIGANKTGGGARGLDEIILKQNEDYWLHILSGANSNACAIQLSWYEHTNK